MRVLVRAAFDVGDEVTPFSFDLAGDAVRYILEAFEKQRSPTHG